MGLTNSEEKRLLDYSLASPVYVALFTTAPDDTGAGTEVSGGGYTRQEITFDAASNGEKRNNADVLFPVATGSWGTITHAAIFDAQTNGTMKWYGAASTTETINVNNQYKIGAGRLSCALN